MSDLMVCVDKRESLASLGERVNKGDSVLRTAHAGNLRNYNLALAAFGVPMVLLDRNITGIDKNYAPEALVS
ncbi:MAG: hypothetical protein HOQ24_00300, partial [Mycobacteriaceae bacterium]|nr:hypothetical protein [Mycobacteriaceae bacterium]